MNINVTLNLYIPSVEIKERNLSLDVEEDMTILGLINLLDSTNNGFKNTIVNGDGEISNEFIVFINGNNVISGAGVHTTLKCGDEVNFIPAIAGGQQ